MPTLRYWDASTGQYVPIMVEGRKGPTGPAGPEGLAGTSGRPEVLVGTQEPSATDDLWVLPDGAGAAVMTRSGDGWVPRHDMGGETVSSVGAPSAPSDIATKGYVDSTVPIGDLGWVNLAYHNGWSTYPGRAPALRCKKTRDGVVYVEGNLLAGQARVPMGFLPIGYRPRYGLHVVAWYDVVAGAFTRITVGADGSISAETPNTGGQFFVLFQLNV